MMNEMDGMKTKKRRARNFLHLFHPLYHCCLAVRRRSLTKRSFLLLCVPALSLWSLSCTQVAQDLGLQAPPPDIERRKGPTGTADSPVTLNPFEKYQLVMAAGECRYFSMKIPERWYWKVFLTSVNKEPRFGKLTAEISGGPLAWAKLPGVASTQSYELHQEGTQGVVGVGNLGPTRTALLKLCQQGAPLQVTLVSEVSSSAQLIAPKPKSTDQ